MIAVSRVVQAFSGVIELSRVASEAFDIAHLVKVGRILNDEEFAEAFGVSEV